MDNEIKINNPISYDVVPKYINMMCSYSSIDDCNEKTFRKIYGIEARNAKRLSKHQMKIYGKRDRYNGFSNLITH